jgi:hypothetical protein
MRPIENNLLVMRMARDEGRLLANVTFGDGRFVLYWIGRLLHRNLVESLDPRLDASGHETAVDLTVGARDTRSIAGLRLGLSLSALYGFRSEVRVVSADAQRDFAGGAGTLDLQVGWDSWRDDGFGRTCDPANIQTCFGITDGSLIDVGVLGSYRFSRAWLVVGDLHLLANGSTTQTSVDPNVYTVLGMLRLQYRF